MGRFSEIIFGLIPAEQECPRKSVRLTRDGGVSWVEHEIERGESLAGKTFDPEMEYLVYYGLNQRVSELDLLASDKLESRDFEVRRRVQGEEGFLVFTVKEVQNGVDGLESDMIVSLDLTIQEMLEFNYLVGKLFHLPTQTTLTGKADQFKLLDGATVHLVA